MDAANYANGGAGLRPAMPPFMAASFGTCLTAYW
jgi:hypothetical protein